MPPEFLPICVVTEQAEGAEIDHEPSVCGEGRGRRWAGKGVNFLEVRSGGHPTPEFVPRRRIEPDGEEFPVFEAGQHDPVALPHGRGMAGRQGGAPESVGGVAELGWWG